MPLSSNGAPDIDASSSTPLRVTRHFGMERDPQRYWNPHNEPDAEAALTAFKPPEDLLEAGELIKLRQRQLTDEVITIPRATRIDTLGVCGRAAGGASRDKA